MIRIISQELTVGLDLIDKKQRSSSQSFMPSSSDVPFKVEAFGAFGMLHPFLSASEALTRLIPIATMGLPNHFDVETMGTVKIDPALGDILSGRTLEW